jgi:hypothetical protein
MEFTHTERLCLFDPRSTYFLMQQKEQKQLDFRKEDNLGGHQLSDQKGLRS